MSLISLQFCAFITAALFLYYLLPLKTRWWVLLAGSAVFFLLSSTPFTALYLVLSITSVYIAACYIENEFAKHRKLVFCLTIALNIAILTALRYLNGLWSTGTQVLSVFGINLPHMAGTGWIAPLGISFYTLQLAGYLTDTYRGVNASQKNPAKLALFAGYFPSLSSGPVLRYGQIETALFEGKRFNAGNITSGAQRVLWGLFKKLVIAERAAMIAGAVFADIDTFTGIWVWLGIFMAVMHIYTDFSGNMDIIIGISECFGITLPENFRQPFFSLTIQEFWQRWHITLGTWLRDYVMYPLQRSRLWVRMTGRVKVMFGKRAGKLVPLVLAMLALWLCNGIWHGGAPKFFMFALWCWFAVALGQILGPQCGMMSKALGIKTDSAGWKLFSRVRTFAVYAVGALFFYAPSVGDAFRMAWRGLRIGNFMQLLRPGDFFPGTEYSVFLGGGGAFALLLSLIVMFSVEAAQARGVKFRQWLGERNIVFRWGAILGLIFWVLLFGVYGEGYDASDFMYAQF